MNQAVNINKETRSTSAKEKKKLEIPEKQLFDGRHSIKDKYPWQILLTAILICSGGSFHFGLQVTILNPTQLIFREFLNRSYSLHYGTTLSEATYRSIWSLILNLQVVGTLVGTLPLIKLSEKLGRSRTFFVSSAFTLFGLLCQALSNVSFSFELLAFGRFLTGTGSGLTLALEGLYLNEISPPRSRGFFGSLTGTFVQLGTIVAGILGLPAVLGTLTNWPWIFVFEMLPTLVLLLGLLFLKESPRYLLAKGREDECKKSLKFFGHRNIDERIKEIRSEIQCQREKVKWKELWQKIYLRKATWLAALVVSAASTSGITAIDYFSTDILVNVGLSVSLAQYASIGIFCGSFLATILGSLLVDSVGRRFLLLATTIGLIASHIGLLVFTIIFHKYAFAWAGYSSILACVGVTIFFGVGPCILQWTIASEMVSQNARSSVQFVVMLVQKLGLIFIGQTFFPLEGAIGAFAFLLFVIPLAVIFAISLCKFPETKGKPVAKVMESLGYIKNKEDENDNNFTQEESVF